MTNEGDIKQGQGRVEEGRLGVCLPSSSGSSKRGERRGGGPPSMAKRGKMEGRESSFVSTGGTMERQLWFGGGEGRDFFLALKGLDDYYYVLLCTCSIYYY